MVFNLPGSFATPSVFLIHKARMQTLQTSRGNTAPKIPGAQIKRKPARIPKGRRLAINSAPEPTPPAELALRPEPKPLAVPVEFDVLLPEKLDSLKDIEGVMSRLLRQELQIREWERFNIIIQGLCFLKAREIHLAQGKRDGEEGFYRWHRTLLSGGALSDEAATEADAEKAFQSASRKARNYMNAARNHGLTAEHSLDDVRALRASGALEKPLNYRLKDREQDGGAGEPPPLDLPEEAMRSLFAALDQVLELRDETPSQVYEAITTRIFESAAAYTKREVGFVDSLPPKPRNPRKKGARRK